MTRIISGSAKGRTLKVPTGGTRPTSDRVRESIFNILQNQLISWNGKKVLDLYAGSGAFAFESISRGAASATAVDKARAAVEVMKHNVEQTHLAIEVIQRDVMKFLGSASGMHFDVIFLDPPYELKNEEITQVLKMLNAQEMLADECIVVVERSARDEAFVVPDFLTLHSERTLGETRVFVLVR